MMKWVMGVFVTLLAIGAITASAVSVFASDIRVRLDGEYVDIYPAPFAQDGLVFVPVRAIAEMLGATVGWDDELRQVTIKLGDIDILLTIDSNIALVNGIETDPGVPARIVGGSTFVPIGFVVEGLGVQIGFAEEVVEVKLMLNSHLDGLLPHTQPFFVVLEVQLLPPDGYIYDAEFLEMFEVFTTAVRQRDLQTLNGFLCEQILVSFGADEGKDSFYVFWGLNHEPEYSALWNELEKIIKLGGFFQNEDLFIAPYTFHLSHGFDDVFNYFVLIDHTVAVYAEANIDSDVIAYLSYNLMKRVELNADFWQKTDYDFVRILMFSGEEGYIFRKHLRSPTDFRLGFSRDNNGNWKIVFMVAGI